MLKNYLRITVLILLLSSFDSFLKCMGWSGEGSSRFENWEKAQMNGPLKLLNFEETEPADNTGRHFGWLLASEFNDQVFVAVTIHDNGYYIDYIDPEYKLSLPYGFYYWRSSNQIKAYPFANFSYKITRELDIIPIIPYEDPSKDSSRQAYKLLSRQKRVDRYQYLNSFKEAFENCCSQVYLYKKVSPIKLTEEDKQVINEGILYMDFNEETKQRILGLLPIFAYDVLKSWLENKLQDSGLENLPYVNKNSKEYVMGKQKIIDQYIIEHIVRFIQIFFYDKNQNQIDIYQILEQIEQLEPCSSQDRREFEEELLRRFDSWDDKRIVGLTAKGLINCNGGLLQWD